MNELVSVCPKCGSHATTDTSNVVLMYPPKFSCKCTKCGYVFNVECDKARLAYECMPSKLHETYGQSNDYNKFEYVSWSKKEFDLPQRATEGSAGYDFQSPVDLVLNPGDSKEIGLEVKCRIKRREFLFIPPRSSLGFKGDNHVTLTNTVGIIDLDYYNNPDNEGEIRIKLHNFGNSPFIIKKGMALVQGIFLQFDTTINDSPRNQFRSGGFGSTDTINNN